MFKVPSAAKRGPASQGTGTKLVDACSEQHERHKSVTAPRGYHSRSTSALRFRQPCASECACLRLLACFFFFCLFVFFFLLLLFFVFFFRLLSVGFVFVVLFVFFLVFGVFALVLFLWLLLVFVSLFLAFFFLF